MGETYRNAFHQLVSFFNSIEARHGWPFMIVGGALTPLYAQSRMTQDIDVVLNVRVSHGNKQTFLRELVKNQFKPFTTWADTFHDWSDAAMLTFLDPSEHVKIDVNIIDESHDTSIYTRIGLLALPRRVEQDFLGIACWVQSKEDFIIAKLVYEGIQDYKDALACWIKHEHDMDKEYLDATASSLGIKVMLDMIMRRVPVGDVFPC